MWPGLFRNVSSVLRKLSSSFCLAGDAGAAWVLGEPRVGCRRAGAFAQAGALVHELLAGWRCLSPGCSQALGQFWSASMCSSGLQLDSNKERPRTLGPEPWAAWHSRSFAHAHNGGLDTCFVWEEWWGGKCTGPGPTLLRPEDFKLFFMLRNSAGSKKDLSSPHAHTPAMPALFPPLGPGAGGDLGEGAPAGDLRPSSSVLLHAGQGSQSQVSICSTWKGEGRTPPSIPAPAEVESEPVEAAVPGGQAVLPSWLTDTVQPGCSHPLPGPSVPDPAQLHPTSSIPAGNCQSSNSSALSTSQPLAVVSDTSHLFPWEQNEDHRSLPTPRLLSQHLRGLQRRATFRVIAAARVGGARTTCVSSVAREHMPETAVLATLPTAWRLAGGGRRRETASDSLASRPSFSASQTGSNPDYHR